jgi:dipeptidyl aminopeptidase/acylaminoacyl peptidase
MKRRTVLRNETVSPDDIIYRAGSNVPIGVEFDDAGHRSEFFDAKAPEAKLYKMLTQAFPGHAVRVTSQTTDGSKAIVHVWSDRSPGDDYVFDLKTMNADHLLTSRTWLDPATQAVRKGIALKARDGLPLRGYVTLPHGTDGKNLPMVVMPHGGPFGIFDRWGFHSEAAMLAAAGYAVLQVNFRGSGNHGLAFEHAGRNQWGKAMQDDVTDATRWSIEQGIADPARICIHGTSYGAYAALMGAAKEPSLYRCASGYVGVYDLAALHTSGDIRDSGSGDTYLQQWVGKPEDLADVSPTRLADKIKVPVLLASGGEDRRAPSTQSDMMEKALKRAGVPVQHIHFSQESHGFYKPAHQKEYFTALLEFLDRNIGAGEKP